MVLNKKLVHCGLLNIFQCCLWKSKGSPPHCQSMCSNIAANIDLESQIVAYSSHAGTICTSSKSG